ncbi:Gfo/Idh/MocA family oxidoreductase [Piscinibacter sp. XHJ-5]|uniref:Gfo/Idh/MocA family protein n=1 Tax=Piscinibacter sp. XHJ-5 TaxID=3037797 RepID=UPI0024531360|nr:Gfo/Idh/MocA family oxidoreductase [Piscinibacter sp. XHJ-5]
MTRRAPLRLAVAGAGLIGRAHIERIADHDDCLLAGVTDPSPAAADVARAAGVPLFDDLPTMLGALRPDGVILATPNAMHVPGALQCIERGVPVLVEKPVADTLEDAHRLADAAAATRVPVLVGHHRRHSRILEAARSVISSGRLGRIVAVNGSATFHKPAGYFRDGPWRTRRGGGPILINLVHEIDNLRMLLGEVAQVQAMASSAARGFEVEDTAAISLRFHSGALGTFLLSDTAASARSWEQTTGENAAYDRHADEDCYIIAGDRGSLNVPTMRLCTSVGEPSWFTPMAIEVLDRSVGDPLARQLAHFCAVIRGHDEPLVSAADAARTLRVTLAVVESARRGGAPVRID